MFFILIHFLFCNAIKNIFFKKNYGFEKLVEL